MKHTLALIFCCLASVLPNASGAPDSARAQNAAAGPARLVLDMGTGISLREGFDAELLYEVPKSQGSWVAMAFDPKGRLIVSDQDDKGAFRVTLPAEGAGIKVESLPGFPYEPVDWGKRKVGGAYGFLYAFECQDVALWREKVLAEKNPRATIYAGIALSRHGDKSLSGRLLDKLGEVPFGSMEREDQLALLRAYALCFMRMGQPAAEKAAAVIAKLDAHFPSKDDTVNAELCRVLASLDAPTVVRKTIELMKATRAETMHYDKEMLGRHEYGGAILKMMANTPNTRNIHYTCCLRRVRSGWTLDDRKYFFGWLNEALARSMAVSCSGMTRKWAWPRTLLI